MGSSPIAILMRFQYGFGVCLVGESMQRMYAYEGEILSRSRGTWGLQTLLFISRHGTAMIARSGLRNGV